MKGRVLLIATAVIFSIFIALLAPMSDVMAVGAPTDNMTIPGFTDGDQAQGEIGLPVSYLWQGSSAQSENTTAGIVPSFITSSGQDESQITGDETWYLDIDVNMDGWIYIYEYYPEGAALQGRWITYKLQLPQSGIWRFGPFIAGDNEPEGQHIYRIWFYNNGKWAGEDAAASQGNLVDWTYSRAIPAEESAPVAPPVVLEQEDTSQNKLLQFISHPLVWSIGLLILVLLALTGFYLYRRYRRNGSREYQELTDEVEPDKQPAAITSNVRARILLPNNMEIKLDGNGRIIRRDDLARALSLDELILISRRHCEIKLQDEQFYIEDLGSANGTSLNHADISGSGSVALNDGDIIGLAGITELKFNLL